MDTHNIKQIKIDDITRYIERSNYGPVEMLISFSTKKTRNYLQQEQ